VRGRGPDREEDAYDFAWHLTLAAGRIVSATADLDGGRVRIIDTINR
jgi:hypothetical protein